MTKYIPKVGERFWQVSGMIDDTLYVEDTIWRNDRYDDHAIKTDNVFKTKPLALLAKKAVEKALREAKKK